MNPILKRGVDISEFNGEVDIAQLKNSGVEFVLIRCGFGGDYRHQDDKRYEDNVKKCLQAKMPWGIYLYAYAKNTDMAQEEASHTLRLLQGKPVPEYGVWYDVEDQSLPVGKDLVAVCKTYCGKIAEAGYQPGIYTFLSWLNQEDRLGCYAHDPQLNQYGLWYAQFYEKITYAYPQLIHIWQYSDHLEIHGKVYDGNYAYVPFPRFQDQKAFPSAEEKTVKVYRYLEDLPQWSKDTVQYYLENGFLTGMGTDQQGRVILNLSEDMLRVLTITKRMDNASQET